MAYVRNIMELIQKCRVNPYYDLSIDYFDTIYKSSRDEWCRLCNFFNFGYVQGQKALLAEQKRKHKMVK